MEVDLLRKCGRACGPRSARIESADNSCEYVLFVGLGNLVRFKHDRPDGSASVDDDGAVLCAREVVDHWDPVSFVGQLSQPTARTYFADQRRPVPIHLLNKMIQLVKVGHVTLIVSP